MDRDNRLFDKATRGAAHGAGRPPFVVLAIRCRYTGATLAHPVPGPARQGDHGASPTPPNVVNVSRQRAGVQWARHGVPIRPEGLPVAAVVGATWGGAP